MEQYFEVLSRCALFDGIDRADLAGMLACLGGRTVEAVRGSFIFLEGDPAGCIGVVLSGTLQIIREDFYGNRSVLTAVPPGGLFAEAFACAGLDTLPVSVQALQDSAVLLLDSARMLAGCANTCAFHTRLIQNLLQAMARKNLMLTQKIRCMSQKTTRAKLMEFLLEQAKQQGSPEFVIPYDRQALADYLGVDRSAMASEIGRLRKSGRLESRGSWFRLLAPEGA